MPLLHIECIDGKCNYSTKKYLESMNCPRQNASSMDLYGAKTSEFDRFRNLGIPAMLLQSQMPIQYEEDPLYHIEEDDEDRMLDEDKFILLLQAVQDHKDGKKTARITKKGKKEKKNKKETQKKK